MEKLLFICGSLNQTTMLHQVAQHMAEYDCYFTPYYTDGIGNLAARTGVLNSTVLGGRHLQDTQECLQKNRMRVDGRGERNQYDLVITSSGLSIQKNIRGKRLVLVQEGITQQSSCTFVAVGLGKEVHTCLDMDELRRLMPMQNNGTSSQRIAGIAKRLLHTPMPVLQQIRQGLLSRMG